LGGQPKKPTGLPKIGNPLRLPQQTWIYVSDPNEQSIRGIKVLMARNCSQNLGETALEGNTAESQKLGIQFRSLYQSSILILFSLAILYRLSCVTPPVSLQASHAKPGWLPANNAGRAAERSVAKLSR
jgi:hypothetical protein